MNHPPRADQRRMLADYEQAYPEDWPDVLARTGEPVWVPDTVERVYGRGRRF